MPTKELLILENVPLAGYSTFGIGGPARFLTAIKNLEELQVALAFAKEKNIPFHILGKGSNTLFEDRGFDGMVIQNKIAFFNQDESLFRVGAGFSFARLGAKTASLGYKGLEFASGIPASVGGAIYMNAGAQGQETKDCLKSVEFVDSQGQLISLDTKNLHFSYRHSPFQKMQGAIISATFELSLDPEAKDRQVTQLQYRYSTQPYSDKSCGCVFKNPEGCSAGALIEKAGLKGLKIGDAEISTMHGNFIVNKGSAKASDVLSLLATIKSKIKELFNVDLVDEIRILKSGGDDSTL